MKPANDYQGQIMGNMADDFQTGSGRRDGLRITEVFTPGMFADGATGNYRCAEGAGDNSCVSLGTNDGTMLMGDWSFNVNAGEKAK